MTIEEIRQKLERKRGSQVQIQKDLDLSKKQKSEIEREISLSEKAQMIIQAVAKITQSELEYRITEPVSLALQSVYDDPYKMSAQFEITGRGVTECHLGFERNGHVVKPTEGSGGGPVDVASFALRIGAWSLSRPRSRAILILDEPLKWVSRNKMSLAGEMLKQVSKQLGLQVIMISHIPELIECADKIINVKIKNGKSRLEN